MLSTILIALLAIGLGAVFSLLGYRLFVILLPVWGFIAGFLIGAQGTAAIVGSGFLGTLTGLIVGVGVGLLVAVLSYFIYSFGVLLLMATFGLGLGAALMDALGIDSGLVIAVVALAGMVGMVALTYLLDVKKYLIVVVTALGGAVGIVGGVLLLFDRISLDALSNGSDPVKTVLQDSIFWLILWLALAGAGTIAQALTTRDFVIPKDFGFLGGDLSDFTSQG